jgi:PAS domain S-box-containing protein
MAARLLIIDDEQDWCDVMQATLELQGYAVTINTSPAAALARLAAEDFDVVLVDLGMAEMEGATLCERILSARPHMPVIVVTGRASMDAVIATLHAGACDFLTKAADPALLAHSVERALQNHRLHQEVKRLRIALDGKDYEEGSVAHLDKIDEMHKAEIAEHTKTHVRDITERKDFEHSTRTRNEELDSVRERTAAVADAKLADANVATRQSEDRFRLLVNGVKDYAICMLDPSGNVASWNAGAERIKGYTAEEIIGKNLSVFYEPADAKDGRPQANLTVAAETGRAEDEGRRVRKDGSTFWANVVLSPIHDSAGVLLGFAMIARDLTERRHLEEQLQQSQKLEAIGSLAGGVAHDFNNLLSIILSYSEMLAADLKEGDPMRDDLGEIRGAGLRAVALTRQLLAFSRRQVLQPKIVDLAEIIGGMEKMLRRLIGEDVELIVSGASGLGKIIVDPGQVEQIIMNLAVNARDAMPTGGKLTIETAEVVLDQRYASEQVGAKPGPHIMLAVSDTGIGMDRATQARIFEPFFTTKDKGKGTGLGLSTVFGIVRQSGGTIWVYSEPGEGTTFKIYFPIADRAVAFASASSLPAERRTLRGSETILLVEDEERVRILARTILRKHGYNVLEAQSGGDAFLLCEQHTATIHLLLTDVVMPRMSGRQLAERLLMVRPGMKVVYMSGYTDDAVMHHGILDSTIAFLQKPITPEALARKVRETLGSAGRSTGPSAGSGTT